MVASIISTKGNTDLLSKLIGNCGCDTKENGGITGTMKRNDTPKIFAIEERPTTINPKTGERVYIDKLSPTDRFLFSLGYYA